MNNTANRSFLLAGSKLIVIAINAVVLIILSRGFTVFDYGIYKDIVLKEALISILGEMGLTSAAIYFISSKNRDEYLTGIINVSIILVLIAIPISYYFSPVNGIGKGLFSLIVILKLLTITSTNMMIAAKNNRFLIIYILIPPLALLFIVTLIWFLSGSILLLLIGLVFRRIIEGIISILFWRTIGNPFRLAGKKVIREIIVFSLPLAVSSVVGILNMNIDKIMVRHFFPIELFAVFTNGAYEIPFLQVFAGSLFTVMIPKLKSLKEENRLAEAAKIWNNLGEITSTVIVPFTVTLIFFADIFIRVMFSDKYIESISIFRIYQLKNLFRIYLYGSIFIAFGENKKLMLNSIISLLINTILNFILLKFYGINGIAVSTVISLLFLVLLQCFQISKFLNIRIYKTYPYVKWLLMIMVSIPVAYVALELSNKFNIIIEIVIMLLTILINFILVSLMFNNTLLLYLLKKIKGVFLNVKKNN